MDKSQGSLFDISGIDWSWLNKDVTKIFKSKLASNHDPARRPKIGEAAIERSASSRNILEGQIGRDQEGNITIADQKIRFNQDTKIFGELRLGAAVTASVNRTSEGVIVNRLVIK
jgi:hypothetical protein